ncbi:ABC transporter ATP-binding protein [Mesotoga sp. Brook.08.YT.4.2.5.1]|uniref:ABC-type transport system involved in Fe-S cluster assembly, ATPase component n=1 Tax=Mesotoga prima TaxID=1184387 RepID=A0A117M3J3_9BACT|nr:MULTISPECIES: ATP-binding cassette domain-containing protein [unclassified Mesotoga]KUK82391.1 MAG: ABC-type transport system involved in Fe-S cluster assembly, ATPase component [Mesotoga prima]RAM59019.1 ABC transporter ATP-binding protein [Mesotoga sp. SC_4PWL113PWK15]PNE22643.1 ABC transporter ATP-binding protein [Mesotoga sp. Brook.08.YT.4.2.5.1]PVD17686.1 ABC transporter ATP-binding protein [Mesotoga sp. Brook.08.105.5.1]RAO95786.1 ABC transporter ATP-binding protein [Mesotoga sp. Broo
MLEVKEVKLIRDERNILNSLTASFEKGRVYAILGNNGVGKSTLSYVLMGLESHNDYEGKILLDGEEIDTLSVSDRAKKGISLSWQEPARFKGLTVKEYLTLGGKLRLSREELDETLSIVGLNKEYLDRLVDESLSGGERKRVELASIMLVNPRVTILDEPDSGIDIMSMEMIERVLERLRDKGSVVIIITHREEIARMADEAYLLCGGRIIASGEPEEIVSFYRKLCDTCQHINEPIREGGLAND